MPLQEHILTSVEWFIRLYDDYGCSNVELEHELKGIGRCDVWGYNKKTNEIFIVEVGSNNEWKVKQLMKLEKEKDNVKVLLVPKNKAYKYENFKFIYNKNLLTLRKWLWKAIVYDIENSLGKLMYIDKIRNLKKLVFKLEGRIKELESDNRKLKGGQKQKIVIYKKFVMPIISSSKVGRIGNDGR